MSDPNRLLVDFNSVSKFYGSKQAVKDLSFQVHTGEIVGLLGPNGAGKSTSMKMLTGCLEPSEGKILVLDHNIQESPQAAQACLGYLPETSPLYEEWTVLEFLTFNAKTRGVRSVKKAVDRAIEYSSLQKVRKQLIGTLSKGYRQRTCFAQSIIHDPPLLVLDEATDGLDPNQKSAMQDFIREMSASKGILFSTHILSEAEAICDRVLVLNAGELVHDGDVASLKTRSTPRQQIRLSLANGHDEDMQRLLAALPGVIKLELVQMSSEKSEFLLMLEEEGDKCGALSLAVADLAVRHHWPIIELKQESSSLDEAFQNLTIGS